MASRISPSRTPSLHVRSPLSDLRRYGLTVFTVEFWVDGSAIPEVNFDVGDSWAGLLPISNKTDETRKVSHEYVESITICAKLMGYKALLLVLPPWP